MRCHWCRDEPIKVEFIIIDEKENVLNFCCYLCKVRWLYARKRAAGVAKENKKGSE